MPSHHNEGIGSYIDLEHLDMTTTQQAKVTINFQLKKLQIKRQMK